MKQERRDFLKLTAVGATGLALARGGRVFAAWPASGTMEINPAISNMRVVGLVDAAMVPTPYRVFRVPHASSLTLTLTRAATRRPRAGRGREEARRYDAGASLASSFILCTNGANHAAKRPGIAQNRTTRKKVWKPSASASLPLKNPAEKLQRPMVPVAKA
jgi:hypothetical protein